MARFSFLFSISDDEIPTAVQTCLGRLFNLGRLRPTTTTILVKVGLMTGDGLLQGALDDGAFEHLLDTSNPWKGERCLPLMAATFWQRRRLFACSLFGLTQKRALGVHEAMSGGDGYIGLYPPTNSAACEYLLDRALIPVVAFHRFAVATSGALDLKRLEEIGLKRATYTDPELFVVRDEIRCWAGLAREGEATLDL